MAGSVWRAVQDISDRLDALAARVEEIAQGALNGPGTLGSAVTHLDKRKRVRTPEEKAAMVARLKAGHAAKQAQRQETTT